MHYSRFYTAYRSLTDEILFSLAAQDVLKKRLMSPFPDVWENGGDFSFSTKTPGDWESSYINYVAVPWFGFTIESHYANGMLTAFGSHSRRALVDWHVEIESLQSGDALRSITITDDYTFIHDIFFIWK